MKQNEHPLAMRPLKKIYTFHLTSTQNVPIFQIFEEIYVQMIVSFENKFVNIEKCHMTEFSTDITTYNFVSISLY